YPASMPRASPITSATETPMAATFRATRPPCSTRENVSRPSWSVPARCSRLGPDRRAGMSRVLGSWGASQGAKMALGKNSTTSTNPNTPWRLRRNKSHFSRRSRAEDSTMAPAAPAMSEGFADTGIEPGDDEVGHEGDDDVQRRRHQYRALDHGEVACVDGIVDQLADAGPGEDDLGEDRAGQQAAEPHADQRDGRQDRDPERVAEHHRARGEAEGARRTDVVLAHYLQHGGAHHAGEIAHPAEADRERG